jgi:hypothetical protein
MTSLSTLDRWLSGHAPRGTDEASDFAALDAEAAYHGESL